MQKAKVLIAKQDKVSLLGGTLTKLSYKSRGSLINIYWSRHVLKLISADTELAVFHRMDKTLRFIAIGLFSFDIKRVEVYSYNISNGQTTYRFPGKISTKTIKPFSLHLKKSIDLISPKSKKIKIKPILLNK
jgi:hypothetical protein